MKVVLTQLAKTRQQQTKVATSFANIMLQAGLMFLKSRKERCSSGEGLPKFIDNILNGKAREPFIHSRK